MMSKIERWFRRAVVRLLIFAACIGCGCVVNAFLHYQLGDAGYKVVLLSVVVMYYVISAKTLRELGLVGTRAWAPNTAYKKGQRLAITLATGVKLLVEALNSGISKSTEPLWNATMNGEVNDNGIVWKTAKVS